MPMTSSAVTATATSCQRPTATRGSPVKTSPTRKAGLSRFAPVSDRAPTAPRNAPMPIAAFR